MARIVSGDRLSSLLDGELRRGVPPAVSQLAAALAERAGGGAAAVLFYGSALRDDALDGVLDFYVLLDRVGAWPGSRLAAMANRVLPPNVGYFEGQVGGRTVRAKFAVMSGGQFRKAMSTASLDTTLWARFSQPVACAWARSDADCAMVTQAVRQAVITAARWAAVLGPARGGAGEFWRALFAHTYAAELRVEGGNRSGDLVARDEDRYARLLPAAWTAGGIGYSRDTPAEILTPALPGDVRAQSAAAWALRRRLGKPLNALRLAKAAFTFEGAMDYVAWKVERHSGEKLEVAEWQRRHPVLAAPGVWWTLRKKGVLR